MNQQQGQGQGQTGMVLCLLIYNSDTNLHTEQDYPQHLPLERRRTLWQLALYNTSTCYSVRRLHRLPAGVSTFFYALAL
jgi:hypothetical protein